MVWHLVLSNLVQKFEEFAHILDHFREKNKFLYIKVKSIWNEWVLIVKEFFYHLHKNNFHFSKLQNGGVYQFYDFNFDMVMRKVFQQTLGEILQKILCGY